MAAVGHYSRRGVDGLRLGRPRDPESYDVAAPCTSCGGSGWVVGIRRGCGIEPIPAMPGERDAEPCRECEGTVASLSPWSNVT